MAIVGSFDRENQGVVAIAKNGKSLGKLALSDGMSFLSLHCHLTRKEMVVSPSRGKLQFYTGEQVLEAVAAVHPDSRANNCD